jgi:DNA-directed RNA polymerase subunit RPC12/RpoP
MRRTMSCPRCRSVLPSTPELDRWLRTGKIEGSTRLWFACSNCHYSWAADGEQLPLSRSALAAGKLRCGECGAQVRAEQLRPLDPTMPRGLIGRCPECGGQVLVEVREDA